MGKIDPDQTAHALSAIRASMAHLQSVNTIEYIIDSQRNP